MSEDYVSRMKRRAGKNLLHHRRRLCGDGATARGLLRKKGIKFSTSCSPSHHDRWMNYLTGLTVSIPVGR
ncbi:hypothetical protein KCP71_25050 [Salmonella enterica subsp. enterica]|nr:hypothetical protein KCP71_25050 [Salmonella enterica subsp. enterica]